MTSSSASCMYDVFRLHEIKSKVSYKFESVASLGDVFFVGTSEGKIIVYQVAKTPTNTVECSTIHIQNSKLKLPVRQIVPIPEKNILIALYGEQIVLHSLQLLDKNQQDKLPGDKMPEIGAIRGAKDVVAFHVKKERGVYSLAAVLKKKVTVYELREVGSLKEFVVVRDGLQLPEGIRTITWSGKGLILGFRKEYVMMDTTTGNIDSLFPTGRSQTPVIVNMDPVPELLIGEESAGVRVSLDGEPAAKTGVVWASLPSCMMFYYPYLLSIHDGNCIEVRNPLLLTSSYAEGRTGSINTLCQTLSIKYVDRLSSRGYVDFDLRRPDANSDPMLLRNDIVIATNGSSSLFMLEMVPIREQALSLAAVRQFEASIDLCRMCPNEVPQNIVNDIRIMFGLQCFKERRYQDAIVKLKEGDADPRFVVSLFPDFLPEYTKGLWKPSRSSRGIPDAQELSETLQDALEALVGYLQPLREPPTPEEYHQMPINPVEDELMIQVTVDTALMRSFVLLHREDELLQFLTKPNWCALDDTESFLRENEQWTALIAFWRCRGEHEQSLELLHTLGVCGTAQPGTDFRPKLFGQPIVKIVDDVLGEEGLPLLPMKIQEIETRLQNVVVQGGETPNRKKLLNQLVGIIGCLYYLRSLDMTKNAEKILFAHYCSWLLANLDPMYSLTMFTKSISKHDPTDVVKTLNTVTEEGAVTSNQRVCKYLEGIMGDQCNSVDDRDLHNERVKALIQMVTEERRPDDIVVTLSQKKLLAFLQRSTLYDPICVVQWLSGTPGYAKSFYRERALVYKRLKQHAEAISMYLNEVGSLEEAKTYATAVSQEEGDAFQILLQYLMKPDANGGVRIREALDVIGKCEGVEARTALPMLPDNTPIAALKDFLVKSLRTSQSKCRSTQTHANVLKSRLQQAKVAAVRVKTKCAVIESDTTCAECQKKIRPDTVFARFPNGVCVHQACLDNEYICPHTHRDFRTGIETILHQ